MSTKWNLPDTKKIKHRLLDMGLTQTALARKVGASVRMVSHVINGTKCAWPLRRKIANAINMPMGEAFPDRAEEHRKTA